MKKTKVAKGAAIGLATLTGIACAIFSKFKKDEAAEEQKLIEENNNTSEETEETSTSTEETAEETAE